MLIALAGDEKQAAEKPLTYPFLEPISPLRFPYNGIDLLFETARFPLPVPIGPMAQVGRDGAGDACGTLAQENAEILAGVCITQLIRPGMPVCYGGIRTRFDMRTTQMVFAGPEQALMAVAMTEMGKHYGLPVLHQRRPDGQQGAGRAGGAGVRASRCSLGALAGADIFGHLGICGVDQATSLSMLVMQNEIIGYVERIMRGVEVNDNTLAVDVIKEVAPRPGANYLAEPHTAKHLRDGALVPDATRQAVLRRVARRRQKTWASGARRRRRSC